MLESTPRTTSEAARNLGFRSPPEDHDRDQKLVDCMARAESRALDEMIARHRERLTRRLIPILGSREEAEEVVQETFLRAWQKAETFDAERSSPAGWLVMMAKSRAIDRIRTERSRRAREVKNATAQPTADEPVGSRRLEREESDRLLGRALDELPSKQRECLELAYYQELTHREIAERLDQPLGTIKSRLRFGLRKLRASVESHFGADSGRRFAPS